MDSGKKLKMDGLAKCLVCHKGLGPSKDWVSAMLDREVTGSDMKANGPFFCDKCKTDADGDIQDLVILHHSRVSPHRNKL